MATSLKRKEFLSRLKPLLNSQKLFGYSMVSGRDGKSEFQEGIFKKSNWKTMDSRSLGIKKWMISSPAFIVLKVLQSIGHEAYLVGGCVRDLLLKKTPKDFDVITTAALKQVRKQFNRAQIVGKKFPICMVHVKGCVIEVSSFQTVAKRDKERENLLISQTPKGCDQSDLARWRNSMHRDFTVNSLFFDPFAYKVFDYANGMKDILDSKLRTLIPAQLSFSEDSARILRGLRIAARLGLSLSNETETAIYKLASLVSKLDKSRISMELNYMLSYGAAEPSLRLLQRFHLLELLLPFHAAYFFQQGIKSGPMMLMVSFVMLDCQQMVALSSPQNTCSIILSFYMSKPDFLKSFSFCACILGLITQRLFFHLDQLVACDRPSDSNLWIGLLAFHLALVNNPQHPHVVATFASVLYHRKWKEGVEFARRYSQAPVIYVPETWTCSIKSDDELTERVTKFSLLVKDSVDAFSDKESLFKAMSTFPDFPCSGLVFLSPNKRKSVRQLFDVPVDEDLNSEGRKSFNINFNLLKNGDIGETRLALGKIILDTMSDGVIQGDHAKINDDDRKRTLQLSDSKLHQESGKKQKLIRNTSNNDDRKHTFRQSNPKIQQESAKKQKLIRNTSNDDDRKHTFRQSNSKIQQESAKKEKLIRKTSNFSEDEVLEKQCEGLKRKHEEMVAADRNSTERKVLRNASDSKSHNNVTKKQEKVEISLIEKDKGQKVIKKHNEVDKKDYKCVSDSDASKEQEYLATSLSLPEQTLMEVFVDEKYSKKTESCKETPIDVIGHFCPKNVATQNQQISAQRCNPPKENVDRKEECQSNSSKVKKKSKEKHHQEKGARSSLSSLFK